MDVAEFKPFAAREPLKSITAAHFRDLGEAALDPARKVAWCTSIGPAELLRSLGFAVFFPENHGALLGASRKANDYIPRATAAGYSPDVCSYLTADVGAFLAGETPLAQGYGLSSVPRPDVLVYNASQCRDVRDWFDFYARRFGVPLVGVHPPNQLTDITDDIVAALTPQYEALVAPLERIAGRRFDIDRFREVVALSGATGRLWRKVLERARHRPSPLTFFDATIHMAPAVVLRGTPQAVTYYETLLAEIDRRIADHVAAVDGEAWRLYWDGMPIWGKLRELAGFFGEARATVVASTYCNDWIFDGFDPADPFASMARVYLERFVLRTDEAKERSIARLCGEYGVDGIIFHEAKTCPNNSNTRYGLPRRLREATGLPSTVVYGDLNDLRCFSEEQAKTSIEAFLEQIAEGVRP